MPELLPQKSNTNQEQKAQAKFGLFASNSLFKQLTSMAVDLLFPPRCAGCGQIDTYWCGACQHEIAEMRLSEPIEPKYPLQGVTASAEHIGKIREAVQALKYGNVPELAKPLGEKLSTCLKQQDWIIDMIVPVPLHTKRLAERGYNQAQLLAEQVASIMGIGCQANALDRIRETQSQVTISGAERLENIKDAFVANSQFVNGRSILVIDDVYTTGSTMSACGEALHSAGATTVYGLTVTAAGHSITHKKEIVDEYHHSRA
ncbi:MAG: ComF family protein [Chloroflexota bacterium]